MNALHLLNTIMCGIGYLCVSCLILFMIAFVVDPPKAIDDENMEL